MRWEDAYTGWESHLLEHLGPDTDVPPEPDRLARGLLVRPLARQASMAQGQGWPHMLHMVLGWPRFNTGTLG